MKNIVLAIAALAAISSTSLAKEREEMSPIKNSAYNTIVFGFETLGKADTAFEKAKKRNMIEGRYQ